MSDQMGQNREEELEKMHRILYKLRSTKDDECVCFTGKEARLLSMYIQFLEGGLVNAQSMQRV